VAKPTHVSQAGSVAGQGPSASLGRKRWGFIALSVTACVALAAIGGPYLWRAADRWVNTPLWGPDPIAATNSALIGSWEGTGGALLSFSTNGQFDASNMPSSMTTNPSPQWSEPAKCMTGGTWSISPTGEAGPGEPAEVELDIGPWCNGGFGFPLQMARVSSRLELYFYIGDPDDDNEFVFKKVGDYVVAAQPPEGTRGRSL
jgi:hypothetical protein